MIIETLSLYFHIHCFKCGVCKGQLGDTTTGTDVRIRNGLLNCHQCYIRSRSAGQPTTLWRSTKKHKVQGRNPIPVLTRLSANHVLHSVSGSLHPLQLDNHWRFIMWAKWGSGDNRALKKNVYFSCLCHLIREWNLDLIGPHATTDCVSSCSKRKRERTRETVLRRRPCWKENTIPFADASNTGRLCWCPAPSEWTQKQLFKCWLRRIRFYFTGWRKNLNISYDGTAVYHHFISYKKYPLNLSSKILERKLNKWSGSSDWTLKFLLTGWIRKIPLQWSNRLKKA